MKKGLLNPSRLNDYDRIDRLFECVGGFFPVFDERDLLAYLLQTTGYEDSQVVSKDDLFDIAFLYSSTGQTTRAIEAYEQYLALAPEDQHAWRVVIELLYESGDLQQTLETIDRCLALFPDCKPIVDARNRVSSEQ